MKLLTLLIMAISLSGCATQETPQALPDFDTELQEQCARDCELFHVGTIRGCSYDQTGTDRRGQAFSHCVEDAYTTLRGCYRSC